MTSRSERVRRNIPYYAQTLEFTCGAAALAMAVKALLPDTTMDRRLELRLWREATLVFMTSGLGGCGPFGLAAAALRRGLPTAVIQRRDRIPFLSGVREPDKKDIVRLVHRDLRNDARQLGVREAYYNFGVEDLREGMRSGSIPILLISTYRLYNEKAPHYVTLSGFDGDMFFLNDPYKRLLRPESGRGKDMMISESELAKMKQYGKDLDKSVIFVYPPGTEFEWPLKSAPAGADVPKKTAKHSSAKAKQP